MGAEKQVADQALSQGMHRRGALADPSDPRYEAREHAEFAASARTSLFQEAPSAMCLLVISPDGRGRIERTNLAFNRLLERDEAELIGSCFDEYVQPHQRMLLAQHLEEVSDGIEMNPGQLLQGKGRAVQLEVQLMNTDGTWWPGQVFIGHPLASGPPARLIAVQDLTAQQRVVEELRVQAFHDALTRLPNRALILDRLQHALEADLRLSLGVSVFYLDLDGFKAINDEHGHATGDEVLRAVADRLSLCVRGGDTVGRLGGDEFVVVAPSLPTTSSAGLHRRLTQALQQGITLPGVGHLPLDASIGIATSRGVESAADVLKAADLDMYRRKVRRRSPRSAIA